MVRGQEARETSQILAEVVALVAISLLNSDSDSPSSFSSSCVNFFMDSFLIHTNPSFYIPHEVKQVHHTKPKSRWREHLLRLRVNTNTTAKQST